MNNSFAHSSKRFFSVSSVSVAGDKYMTSNVAMASVLDEASLAGRQTVTRHPGRFRWKDERPRAGTRLGWEGFPGEATSATVRRGGRREEGGEKGPESDVSLQALARSLLPPTRDDLGIPHRRKPANPF